LTIAWTNLLSGDGSAPLLHSCGPDAWTASCVDDGLIFKLGCNSGNIELRGTFFIAGDCPDGESNYCSNFGVPPFQFALASHTCSPFSLTFNVLEDGCPAIYGAGNTQLVITGPETPPACPVCFHVTGCNGSPVAGATVSISGGASGTTEACGLVILDVGTAGTYTVGVTYSPAPRFDSFSQSMTVTCGQSVTIPLVTASGYHCSCLGSLPLADTLTLSTSAGGGTLTWNVVGVSPCLVGDRWSGGSGTLPFSAFGCTATTVTGPFEFATGIICAPSLTYSFDYATYCPASSSFCNSLLPWDGGTLTGTHEPLNLTWTNGANTAALTE
jgi:hypothetical protein